MSGADCVFLDWEHTPMSIREITNLIRTIQTAGEGNVAVVVRYVLLGGLVLPLSETYV